MTRKTTRTAGWLLALLLAASCGVKPSAIRQTEGDRRNPPATVPGFNGGFPGALSDVERDRRLHVWALGRRASKTTMAALVMSWDALLRPELDACIRPGERRYAVAIATNLRQARLLIRAAASIVKRSPLLAGLIEAETEDEILFRNGTAIAAFPCTSRSAGSS